jgi:DNA-binding Lrp family transcriptional regulator
MTLSGRELALVDRWQRDFPLVAHPFAAAGSAVGLDEATTIAIFRRLQEQGVLSRIGAVVRPHTVGASTLAAMRVPSERLEDVAACVSREPLVNHNYQRTHDFNLWFVIAGPDPASVTTTIARIEKQTKLSVLDLPLIQAYHLDLGFSLTGERDERRVRPGPKGDYRVDQPERDLLAAIEDGLPIVARPYRAVAERIDRDEEDVLDRLSRLAAAGVVSRFGCIVRHRALGYTANAMAVWDVVADVVDQIGQRFARLA